MEQNQKDEMDPGFENITESQEKVDVDPTNKDMHLDEILLYSLQNHFKQFCIEVEDKLNQFINNPA